MTSTLQLRSGRITKMQRQMWTPQRLFTSGTVGVWYDPADFSTMFQDSAGTTPVTQLGQPVGLILDKSTNFAGASLPLVRRNLLTYSEQFDNSIWGKGSGTTVTPNVDTAPDGTLTADRLVNLGAAAGDRVSQAITIQNSTIVGSVWLKGEGTDIGKDVQFTAKRTGGTYSGTVISHTLTANWVRVSASFTQLPENTGAQLVVGVPSSNSASNCLTWGAQLESGSTPSTYQPVTDNWVNALPTSSGNHAIQSTIGARPTIQARKNLLTYTEQFDDAVWPKLRITVTPNQIIAPNGTLTADLVAANATGALRLRTSNFTGLTVGTAYTFSIYAKKATVGNIVHVLVSNLGETENTERNINLDTNVISSLGPVKYPISSESVTDVGDGWKRYVISITIPSGQSELRISVQPTGNSSTGNENVYLWGAQLELAPTASSYQRVVTATDYVDVGVPRGLQFDGVDDGLVTLRNVDFSGTDKITVFTGVFKNSDTTTGVISELTPSAGANNGGWALGGPWSPTSKRFAIVSRGDAGTVAEAETIDTVYNAPSTRVLTGQSNISGDTLSLRIDGVLVKSSTTDQGAGNYANAQLFIGSRNQASLRFNGRIHQLCIIGRTADVTELNLTERFTGLRTGVSL